ncbi:hypothetical protein SteCoe_36722 [Stentor coeruleus]|uniref:Uncharacterized protein n=1 Tax=Stentor coeruleus TaxID=5963 RepID=A0A1R2APG4_9CILI|nr:hypothetical protein SteCoe_36722 [Stentor coeruleus]
MGCTISRHTERKLSSQIARKIIPKMHRTETLGSILTNNGTYSRMNSSQNPICLNIKIYPQCPKIAYSPLDLSGTQANMLSYDYISDYNYIKDIYSLYSATLSYFMHLVHDACFRTFTITDGIYIMIISFKANPNCNLKYLSKPPFIEIEGILHEDSMKIWTSWKMLMDVVEDILKKNTVKINKCIKKIRKFEEILKDYVEYSLRPQRIEKAMRLCDSAVQVAEDIVRDAKEIAQVSKKFIDGVKDKSLEIEKLAKKALELGVFSGERIVHNIFTN